MSRKPDAKKPNIKLYLTFALVVVVVFGAYRVVVSAVDQGQIAPVWYSIMMWTYLILAGAGFVATVIINKGFYGKLPTADELPSNWDHVKKTNYITDATKRRRISKYVLIPTVAFIFVFFYEIIELYYFPAISNWLASF